MGRGFGRGALWMLGWGIVGIANGWAQETVSVAAVAHGQEQGDSRATASLGTTRLRWGVQSAEVTAPPLAAVSGEPVVLRMAAAGQPLSFYLQNPQGDARYRYRLSGLDTQWHALSSGVNVIRYATLPAGHYRFQVQSGVANPQLLCDVWVAAAGRRTTPWLPPLAVLAALLLWGSVYWLRASTNLRGRRMSSLAHLHEQNRQLQRRLESHGQLAHELRSSLMLLTPQLAPLHAAGEPTVWPVANQATRGVARLQGLLHQLIQLIQTEPAPGAEHQTLILLAWITPRLKLYRQQAEARQISWHIAMLPDIALTLDSHLLDELLCILLQQTLQMTSPGGEIRLAFCLDESGNRLKLRVQGSPLAARNDAEMAATEDNGETAQADALALRLLQQRVSQQGGELSRTDDEGWQVHLPCLWTDLQALTPPPPTLPLAPAEAPLLLLVEEDPDLQQLLLSWLSGEYRILVSSSIRGGLSSAREAIPDLILCDQQLPDGEGYALLEALKSTVETSHIPIIIGSVLSDVTSRRRAWHQRADDYIQKPYEPAVLRLRLQALLQNRQRLQQWLHARLSQNVLVSQTSPLDLPVASDLPPAELQFSDELRRVSCQLLRENTISLEKIAEQVKMSSRSLQRKLHSLFGLTYSDYVRELQLQLVVEQLQLGVSIKEAAAAAGYRDQAYLARVFKQQFGITPSQYKKQQGVGDTAQT